MIMSVTDSDTENYCVFDVMDKNNNISELQ